MIEYIGQDWSAEECEEAYLFLTTEKLRACESELYSVKHWDYRLIHPLQATMLFAEHYKNAIKAAIIKRTDLYVGLNYKGLKHDNLLECSDRTIQGMIKARQTADENGVPYNIWCYQAMKFAMEVKLPFLPQPHMLYGKKPKGYENISMVDYILRAFMEAEKSQTFYAQDSFYNIDNYCSNPYQMQHQRHIVDRIEKSNVKVAAIAKIVFDLKLVFPEVIKRRFGEDMLLRAERYHLA